MSRRRKPCFLAFTAFCASLIVAACAPHPNSSTDAPSAASSSVAAVSAAAQQIDYGVMGDPNGPDAVWKDIDPQFPQKSPEAKLASFRDRARHQPQVDWMQTEEFLQFQRALYYSVLANAPQLITARDRHWISAEEKQLVALVCEEGDSPQAPYTLSDKHCKDAGADEPAPASPPAGDTASADIAQGTPYAQARTSLLNKGYSPVIDKSTPCAGMCFDQFPELVCAGDTPRCASDFKSATGAKIHVVATYDEDSQAADNGLVVSAGDESDR